MNFKGLTKVAPWLYFFWHHGGTMAVFFTPGGFTEPERAQFRRLGLAPENKSAEGARREAPRSRREAPIDR